MVLPIKFRSGSPSCYCVKVDSRTELFLQGSVRLFLFGDGFVLLMGVHFRLRDTIYCNQSASLLAVCAFV